MSLPQKGAVRSPRVIGQMGRAEVNAVEGPNDNPNGCSRVVIEFADETEPIEKLFERVPVV